MGRFALPLLRVIPDGSEQVYALKSKKFEKRAKGVHPGMNQQHGVIKAWLKRYFSFSTITKSRKAQ